jgi:hypothetical protein
MLTLSLHAIIMLNIIATLVVFLPFVAGTGTITCNNSIVDFNVLHLSTSPPIVTDLTPVVDLLDFPSCTLNIEAILSSTPSGCDKRIVKCVQYFLDGALVNKEKFTPYTFFKNTKNGTISQRKPPIGKHTIKACTYSDKACTKDEGGCKEIKVEFLDCDRQTTSPVKPPIVKPPVRPPVKPPVKPPFKSPVMAPVKPPTVMTPVQPPITPPVKAPTVKAPTVKSPTVQSPTVKSPTVQSPTVKPPTVKPPTVKPPTVKPPTVKPPPIKPPVKPPVKSLKVACDFFNIDDISFCQSITDFSPNIYIGVSGTIRTEIGLLTQITHLFLTSNRKYQLSGTIPSELGNLVKL